jgi:rubrerythrin
MSYEDMKSIFKDVLEFEEQALAMYGQIVMKITNDKIKAALNDIMLDEARHAKNAREILQILEK